MMTTMSKRGEERQPLRQGGETGDSRACRSSRWLNKRLGAEGRLHAQPKIKMRPCTLFHRTQCLGSRSAQTSCWPLHSRAPSSSAV